MEFYVRSLIFKGTHVPRLTRSKVDRRTSGTKAKKPYGILEGFSVRFASRFQGNKFYEIN